MINANKTANINQPSTSGPNKNIDSYGVAPDGSVVRVDWSTWPLYDGTPNKVTTPNKRIVAHVDGVPVQSGEGSDEAIIPTRTITPNHREVVYGINADGDPAPLVQTGYGIAVKPSSASSPNKTNLVWVIGKDGSPIPLQVGYDGKIIIQAP